MAANDIPHQVHPITSGFEEVEKLVQQLYLPGSPQNVSRVENVLQRIQRSPQGWQLADALLQSRDAQVRFFGALTFMIKIKLDWDTLGNGDAPLLLDRLLLWVVRLVNATEGALVLRKMCASLVSYFLRPSVSWQLCVRHLLCCFNAGDAVPVHALSQRLPTAELVGNLSQLQLLTGLWFCVGLVEEVGKTDDSSIETHRYHDRVVSDLDDVVLLLRHTMNPESTQNFRISEEGIKCFQSWVLYAYRAWIGKALDLGTLRVLTPLALHNLTVPDLFNVSAEFFTDVLTNFPAFLTASDFVSLAATLSGGSAQGYIAALRTGRFDLEQMVFARLLFAYGEAMAQDLATNVSDPNSRQILCEFVELLGCEGYAGAEDEACSPCLEFWSTFTEFLIDSLYGAGKKTPPWLENAIHYLPEVIEACWKKIQAPSYDVALTWDSEDRASFNAFRADAEDLLQSSFTLMGIDMFKRFANLTLESLNSRAWPQLEATLFCLNALSDAIAEEVSSDEVLSRLFDSSLFAEILGPQSNTHPKTRQTAINLVVNYTSFFERHTEYLPPMLNFLFESLKAAPIAGITAKAILETSWACRKALLPELGAFLRQYEILLAWDNVDSSTKARVMGAIAGIIQALPSDDEKVDPLNVLLHFVETDVQICVTLLKAGKYEEAQAHGLCALRCLTYMGKAFQAPDDVAIDLDSDTSQSTVWGQERLDPTQAKIIELMSTVTSSMKGDSDIMEAACHTLRTGFKESTPGPFVFPAFVIEQFFVSSDLQTARLELILDTVGNFIGRHSTSAPVSVHNAAVAFFIHVLRLIDLIGGNPGADPEVASSCIDLAEKLIGGFLPAFLHDQVQNNISILFLISLRCLASAEIMPKRSAAVFWASFVEIRDKPKEIQSAVDKMVQEYGPQLSQALIMNIGGEAARSDLDSLAGPLKSLVCWQPKAKTWLTDALSSEYFPSQNVGAAEKRFWLQKILSLRGARGTTRLIKEFWMLCRGTNLSFGS